MSLGACESATRFSSHLRAAWLWGSLPRSVAGSAVRNWYSATPIGLVNTLDSIATVRKLVEFYVQPHNELVPHSAFKGQTPEEMYFATGADVPEKLQAAHLLVTVV